MAGIKSLSISDNFKLDSKTTNSFKVLLYGFLLLLIFVNVFRFFSLSNPFTFRSFLDLFLNPTFDYSLPRLSVSVNTNNVFLNSLASFGAAFYNFLSFFINGIIVLFDAFVWFIGLFGF